MNAPFFRPAFCPNGIDPADWRKALVERIEQQAAILSALVDALDQMEDDADLEPWLGAVEVSPNNIGQTKWGQCLPDDLEEENEHGGDVQDEPHDETDEGNDESSVDDVCACYSMSEADREHAWEEAERLIGQARAMLPANSFLRFPGA